jgi:hypothetical protein
MSDKEQRERESENACEPQVIDFSEPHILVDEGLSGAIVCSTGTEEEALAWLQKEVPVVVGNWSWQRIEHPTEEQKPIACKESRGEGRMHYLFEC